VFSFSSLWQQQEGKGERERKRKNGIAGGKNKKKRREREKNRRGDAQTNGAAPYIYHGAKGEEREGGGK